jgi:membrane-bound hydrogenase subunit mbhJ
MAESGGMDQERATAKKAARTVEALKRALWVYLFNSGSCNGCDIENVALITPRYDAERFGIKVVGSPRHADVLFVTGPVSKKLAPRLRLVYEQMPEPKVVVCVGSCGTGGGVFYDSYNLEGPVDQIVPVDVYVPGCPPRPEAIIHGVVKAIEKLERAVEGKPAKAEAEQPAAEAVAEVAPETEAAAPAEAVPAETVAAAESEPAPAPEGTAGA